MKEYMSGLVHTTEPVPQTFASKAHEHRKLDELNFVKGLDTKAKRSLETNVYHCINLKRPFGVHWHGQLQQQGSLNV